MSAAQPYTRLAAHYDEFVGHAQFCQARRIFEHCERAHGLTFSRVADLGCGTGLFAQYVASNWGVPVYAVDRSSEMLRVAANRHPRCSCILLLCDYKKLMLREPVDLITMFSFTLNLADSKTDVLQTLDSIWRNLSPGGSCILDFLTPSLLDDQLPPKSGGRLQATCQRVRRFCLDIKAPSRKGKWLERHCARLLPPIPLHDQLVLRGFQLIDALDHATLGPARQSSPALVFVLRKPGQSGCLLR